MRVATILAVPLSLLAGCSNPTALDNPNVEVRTDRLSYGPGEDGVLSLTNRHGWAIEVSHAAPDMCGLAQLDRKVQGEWGNADKSACQLVLIRRELNPGETLTLPFTIPDSAEVEGEYRFRIRVRDTRTGESSDKFSNVFTVEDE